MNENFHPSSGKKVMKKRRAAKPNNFKVLTQQLIKNCAPTPELPQTMKATMLPFIQASPFATDQKAITKKLARGEYSSMS